MSDGENVASIRSLTTFPIKNPKIRNLFARDDVCPDCGGELDTGFECTNCGYDAMTEAYPPHVRGKKPATTEQTNPQQFNVKRRKVK